MKTLTLITTSENEELYFLNQEPEIKFDEETEEAYIEFWDGTNMRKEHLRKDPHGGCSYEKIRYDIIEEFYTRAPYYFKRKIKLETHEEVTLISYNCSGFLNPYWYVEVNTEDEEYLEVGITTEESNITKELLGNTYESKDEMVDDLASFAKKKKKKKKHNVSKWGDEDSGCGDADFYISMGNYQLWVMEDDNEYWIKNYS